MDYAKSIVTTAIEIGSNVPAWLVALMLVAVSLAAIFIAAVIWDFTGRITTVRSESGKVEVSLSPRTPEIKR